MSSFLSNISLLQHLTTVQKILCNGGVIWCPYSRNWVIWFCVLAVVAWRMRCPLPLQVRSRKQSCPGTSASRVRVTWPWTYVTTTTAASWLCSPSSATATRADATESPAWTPCSTSTERLNWSGASKSHSVFASKLSTSRSCDRAS
jgi:hypothetical protein